jgi:hypothetical protein
MSIDNIQSSGFSNILNEAESEELITSDQKREFAERHLSTFMGYLAEATQPKYSLGELADILDEPELQLQKLSQTNRSQINIAVRFIKIKFPHYPDISSAARKTILDWAEQTKRQDTRRALQLAALSHAVRCYSKLTRIVPKERLDLQQIEENFIKACWWTALWQDLIAAHGDQLPTYFIFE